MIQNAFKLWAEKERGRMLMKENWRTHHDYECYWVMNTIYRYMFRYGLTVFQIRMHATFCQNTTHCHASPFHPIHRGTERLITSHCEFELSLYGCIDKEQLVTPWDILPITEELPKDDWNPPWSRYEDTKYG